MTKDKMYVGGDMRTYYDTPSPLVSTIMAIIMLIIVTIVLIFASYEDTHYTQTAEVLSIDSAETLFVDGAGYVWSVYDTDYHKGQFVKLYFDNNRTDYTRNDDKIIKVKTLDN